MARDRPLAPPKPVKHVPPGRDIKGPGRPKGVPNRLTSAARDTIAQACEEIGGWQRLAEWALETPANETMFWSTIYPRLLPLEVRNTGTPTGVQIGVQIIRFSDVDDPKVINGSSDAMAAAPAQVAAPRLPKS